MYHNNSFVVNTFNSYTNQHFSFYKPNHNLPSNRLKKLKLKGFIFLEELMKKELLIRFVCYFYL